MTSPNDGDLETIIQKRFSAKNEMNTLAAELEPIGKDALVRVAARRILSLLEALRGAHEIAATLALEAQQWRSNWRVYQEVKQGSDPFCLNCRHWKSIQSVNAMLFPRDQVTPSEPGACTINPPVLITQGTGKDTVAKSMFPPVHPFQVCGRHERASEAAS